MEISLEDETRTMSCASNEGDSIEHKQASSADRKLSKSEIFNQFKAPVLTQMTRLIPYIKTSRKGGQHQISEQFSKKGEAPMPVRLKVISPASPREIKRL